MAQICASIGRAVVSPATALGVARDQLGAAPALADGATDPLLISHPEDALR